MRVAGPTDGSVPSGEVQLRGDFAGIVAAALAAVDPERCVVEALDAGTLAIPPAPDTDRPDLVLVAVGKAAPAMARGALRRLGRRVRDGVVLAPSGPAVEREDPEVERPDHPGLRLLRGGHPLPTPDGVVATRAIVDLVRGAGAEETVLVLLSGGGSSLLTLPADGLTLDDVRTATRGLLRSGAEIGELNAVRKHLDRVKGGRLARTASPAAVRAAVLSDVVGDRLDVIASAPVSPDPSRYADAVAVLERYGSSTAVPERVREHLEAGAIGDRDETPGAADPCFRRVRTSVVGSVAKAVAGAREEALRRGYRVRVLGTELTGEAREVGAHLGRIARRVRESAEGPEPPACLLAGGETTVTVRGDGRGGRNQELALGATDEVAGLTGVLVGSVGTDGVDGPTDAAGALVTGSTAARAARAGLRVDDALERNDSHPFFRTLGDLVVTGPTGTNVMDLQVVLVDDGRERSGAGPPRAGRRGGGSAGEDP